MKMGVTKMALQNPGFAIVLLFCLSFAYCGALVAYDCKDIDTAHATFSLVELSDCVFDVEEEKKITQTVQLLQPRKNRFVPFIACNVEYRQVYYSCGHQSHIYLRPGHITSGVDNIPKYVCQDMHRSRSFVGANGKTINDLNVNNTIKAEIIVAGSLDASGNCEHGDLVTEKGTLTGLIYREYEITLTSGVSTFDSISGITKFTKTHACRLHEGQCELSNLGNIFVNPYQARNCDEESYKAIFEGVAEISLQ